ncbi:glycosyl transferase (plasmid) [Pedobacter sp. BS3]|uniref:glycosyl transferase n=1 Tax=Pedobacter sp. BS3 TaxID=2567937 RepID=UPI0011EFEA90|nr:glycosyl transferase [Pedobacter sp. BS3]TZF86204.1 glycosyl transferase [Pedobacter sp. BS3]
MKAYRSMLAGQKAMIHHANHLPPVYSDTNGHEIYFLTGKKYLYQTLFCIASLNRQSSVPIQYVLVDDGSFDTNLISRVRAKLPGCRLVLAKEIMSNLEKQLPARDFPILHKKREEYAHIKKLTDIHTILSASPYKLVLDSDMLFWQPPLELINWMQKPASSVYMVDCEESYGYTKSFMAELCGHIIPDLVNVGIIGLNSTTINWYHLEHWIKRLEAQEGTCYYLEQALTAMLVAGQTAEILHKNKYIVNPDMKEINQPQAIMHHYVDLSKYGYYTLAWQKIFRDN